MSKQFESVEHSRTTLVAAIKQNFCTFIHFPVYLPRITCNSNIYNYNSCALILTFYKKDIKNIGVLKITL